MSRRALLRTTVMVLTLLSCSREKGASSAASQVGVASWYGEPFHGRRTASGEIFDMTQNTAAHRTLAFGTLLRVQNLSNGKTVDVRINDRGPFVEGRTIDLSRAAARAISIEGIGEVRLEVMNTPRKRATDLFAVQVGSFPRQSDAERLREEMEARYGTARFVYRDVDRTWRVLVGLSPTLAGANTLQQQIGTREGPTFIVLVDSE